MIIKNQLLAEHSKNQATKIAIWIGDDPGRFAELVELVLQGEPLLAQRAAWALSHSLDRHPDLIYPHLGSLVQNMCRTDQHPAVRRNTLRALQEVEIPETLWGKVADLCFQYLADPKEPAAIRVFAMTVLWNICRQVPELQTELKLIIEDHWNHATAGFRSRGQKILKAMRQGPDTVSTE